MSAPPILTSAAGNGGIVAQDGFDYQLFFGVARIAEWLGDPTFEGVMFEALEDVEARFFAPQSDLGHLLIRIQAKSGSLDRADILAVLDNFVAFEQHYPGTAKAFELVTPQLPAKMNWIVRDLERVRFAGPFYAPFRAVTQASSDEVRTNLVDELGADRGGLLFERGEVVLRPITGASGAFALFAEAFEKVYPDVALKRAVFDDLVTTARNSTKSFLTRAQILESLEASLKARLESAPRAILHVVGDRPGPVSEGAVRLDAGFLSGDGRLSGAAVWEADLVQPLRRLKSWWQERGRRRILVEGSYRLSTAFAIGATFNAGSGLDLDIVTKDGVWRTDDHANGATVAPAWATTPAARTDAGALNVAVGVLRDPVEALTAKGANSATIARAFLDEAVTSGQQMQAIVAGLKRFIAGEVTRLGATQVNLYFVGPAALAIALGHRWNAVAPVQLHEFDAPTGSYFPTAHL
ncbi:MAG TPA: dsDNA nuclease domain-containing protein [Caulobacter sp.]|nr:dsDNA nuclease domain-containing protein [Caulobacter sp.]